MHPFAFAKGESVRSTTLKFSRFNLTKLGPWLFVFLRNVLALLRVLYYSSVVGGFPGDMMSWIGVNRSGRTFNPVYNVRESWIENEF